MGPFKKKKDITIRFIPNILSEEGRILKSLPYNRDWTIRKYLKKSGFEFKDMHIEGNGFNKIKNLSQHLQIGDEIVVMPSVEDPATFAFLFNVAFWHGLAVVTTIASIGYSIYSAFAAQRVKAPSFDIIGEGMDTSFPFHSLDGLEVG